MASQNSSTGTGGDAYGTTPTYAAFTPQTPNSYKTSPLQAQQQSTVLVHQKSPLLVATPPQITRALAHLYPYLLLLNRLAGLLTWTTGDIWESFLLLATFWAVTLYGDVVIRYAGPLVGILGFMAAMYARRFSIFSSKNGWTGTKEGKEKSEDSSEKSVSHRRSLDDIVETVRLFTARCDILLEPFLEVTTALSTQRTATSATTQPALITLFIRALILSPFWLILATPFVQFITTKRAVLIVGTTALTWHSPAAKVLRTILWRSRTIRQICHILTGLQFEQAEKRGFFKKVFSTRRKSKSRKQAGTSSVATTEEAPASKGIRFTFSLYENQRRWLGIGWTSSMLANERAAWTDDRGNAAPPKEKFKLPQVEGAHARWRWVKGSEWEVDLGEGDGNRKKSEADQGWVYCDNKWRNARRGQDGWGKYTRWRKWHRDAELVDITSTLPTTSSSSPMPNKNDPTPSAITSTTTSSSSSSASSLTPSNASPHPPPYTASACVTPQPSSEHGDDHSNTASTSVSQGTTIVAEDGQLDKNSGKSDQNSINASGSPQSTSDSATAAINTPTRSGKGRRSWFGGGSDKLAAGSASNGSSGISITGRRRSSGSNSHTSSYRSGRSDGARGGGSRRDRMDEEEREEDEMVGTPVGTQEQLDHYAYGRGLGEDAMMGLG